MIEHLFAEIFNLAYTQENVSKIIAGAIFLALGFIVQYSNKVTAALDKENRFSFCYFWADNKFKILSNIIIMFLTMRFSQAILGVEPTMIIAVFIGYSSDYLRKKFDNAMNGFRN
jgi:hypothetical protein